MKLPDKVYDFLKWFCLICLPAVAWGYGKLAEIWHWPYQIEVPETINLIAFILGVLIGVSTLTYNKEMLERKADSEE